MCSENKEMIHKDYTTTMEMQPQCAGSLCTTSANKLSIQNYIHTSMSNKVFLYISKHSYSYKTSVTAQ